MEAHRSSITWPLIAALMLTSSLAVLALEQHASRLAAERELAMRRADAEQLARELRARASELERSLDAIGDRLAATDGGAITDDGCELVAARHKLAELQRERAEVEEKVRRAREAQRRTELHTVRISKECLESALGCL